jgi:hypothetical protein
MILSYITRRISTLIAILPVLLIQITALASPAPLPYHVFFSIPPNLTGTADANINWIQSTSYDMRISLYRSSFLLMEEPGQTEMPIVNLGSCFRRERIIRS